MTGLDGPGVDLNRQNRPPGGTRLEALCEIVCAASLISMIVLIGSEAIARNIFGFSFEISDEVGGYLLVAVAFLSLPVAQAHGAFHNVELIQGRLGLQARLSLQIVFDIATLAACLIILWQLWRLEYNSYQSGDVAPTPLLTPLWIPRLVMPAGMAAFCLTLARTVWLKVQLLRGAERVA